MLSGDPVILGNILEKLFVLRRRLHHLDVPRSLRQLLLVSFLLQVGQTVLYVRLEAFLRH